MTNQFGSRQPNEPQPGREGTRKRPRIRPQSNRDRGASPDLAQDESFEQPREQGQVKSPRFQLPEIDETGQTQIDQKKRSIALVFDILVAFSIALICTVFTSLIGMVLSKFIPGLNRLITKEIFIVAYFLVKDRLYRGRGIGKNLMGLRVVSATNGAPCTLLQSAKRNIIFIIPFLVQFSVTIALNFIPLPDLRMIISNVAQLVCMAYVLIVIPLECYLAYSAINGRRLGDLFAGTEVVEADMNFSDPLR